MLEESQRRRAMRRDMKIARQAQKIASPINRQISALQSNTVRLIAFAEKLRSTGQNNPAVIAEAEELTRTVTAHLEELREKTRDLPPEVASCSWLQDTNRALTSVLANVNRVRAIMQTETA
jgi:hypothetical protein